MKNLVSIESDLVFIPVTITLHQSMIDNLEAHRAKRLESLRRLQSKHRDNPNRLASIESSIKQYEEASYSYLVETYLL